MTSIKIATWNICLGMFNKIQLIKEQLYRESLDVLFLNETEINEKHDQKLMKIEGYDLIIPNIISRIACYVKNSIKYEQNQSSKNLDTISLNVGNLKILGLYRGFKLINHQNSTEQISTFRASNDRETSLIVGSLS